jgi:hypothetical protein
MEITRTNKFITDVVEQNDGTGLAESLIREVTVRLLHLVIRVQTHLVNRVQNSYSLK